MRTPPTTTMKPLAKASTPAATPNPIELPSYILWSVLKTCRENRSLSGRKLAVKMGKIGHPTTQSAIAKAESGRQAIGEETLAKFAAAYGLTVRDLLLEGLAPAKPAKKTPKRRASKKALAG